MRPYAMETLTQHLRYTPQIHRNKAVPDVQTKENTRLTYQGKVYDKRTGTGSIITGLALIPLDNMNS